MCSRRMKIRALVHSHHIPEKHQVIGHPPHQFIFSHENKSWYIAVCHFGELLLPYNLMAYEHTSDTFTGAIFRLSRPKRAPVTCFQTNVGGVRVYNAVPLAMKQCKPQTPSQVFSATFTSTQQWSTLWLVLYQDAKEVLVVSHESTWHQVPSSKQTNTGIISS